MMVIMLHLKKEAYSFVSNDIKAIAMRCLKRLVPKNQTMGINMTTEPINCNEALKRLECDDYDLCSALLTMLLREDHFL